MGFVTTQRGQVQSDKCCILFDPSNGAIRHVHRVITLEGAEDTPRRAIEGRALKLAKDLGVGTRKVKFLHVDSAAITPGTRYVVDQKQRCLVAVERISVGKAKRPTAQI